MYSFRAAAVDDEVVVDTDDFLRYCRCHRGVWLWLICDAYAVCTPIRPASTYPASKNLRKQISNRLIIRIFEIVLSMRRHW